MKILGPADGCLRPKRGRLKKVFVDCRDRRDRKDEITVDESFIKPSHATWVVIASNAKELVAKLEQNANGQRQGHTQNEWIARTRSICNMVRFDRWLDSCNLIFVPIHSGNLGELGGHWWLLVIDPRRQVAEIWDSAPSTSSLPVRTRMAYNVLSHLQETVSGTLPGHDFQQYRTVTPANVPIQPNEFDCAIFVIQHMQYYGTRWWIDYHSDEQRSGILLHCMKSSASNIHDEVRRRADDYYFGRLC